jgi:acyl-CoA synthetase (AMP-forming)/AMP-acid ligase II
MNLFLSSYRFNKPMPKISSKSLRYVFSGGTSMPAEIVRQWVDAFGIPIHEAYGMTEAVKRKSLNRAIYYMHNCVGVHIVTSTSL